jgi:uncharacterized protein (DUF427 family)
MAWMLGSAPFGQQPAGRFNKQIDPDGLLYLEQSPKWIRARVAGETVADSKQPKLLHEHLRLPVILFPKADVRMDLLRDSERREQDPVKGEQRFFDVAVGDVVKQHAAWSFSETFVAGLVGLDFGAMDEWLEEDERLLGHARDPYSRIDVRDSSRQIRVRIEGELVAESTRTKALFESGLPTRWYFPADDVRMDLLSPSETRTTCAYKGFASHWSFGEDEDVAWTYDDPLHDALDVKGRVAFYNERVDLEIDGEVEERPQTEWARSS